MEKSNIKVPCEVYTRIVGYHRPVTFWHKGKKEEFKERKMYDVNVCMSSIPKSAIQSQVSIN